MIEVLIVLVIVGVCLYLLQQVPMDASILLVIRVVVILCVILWLLRVFGVVDLPIPRIR